jgi:hypothetical protein
MNFPRSLVILATFGQKNSLTTGSCLGPLDATNLPQPLLLSGTSGYKDPPSVAGPVWGTWIQAYPSPCSCLGLDTKILPQLLVLSGALGHNKPTPALVPLDTKNSNLENVSMNSDAAQAVPPAIPLQHTVLRE